MADSVEVLLFGRLGDIAGHERLQLQLSAPQSCAELREALTAQLPQLKSELHKPRTMVAINKTVAQWESQVTANDEVAFLPPVTGG